MLKQLQPHCVSDVQRFTSLHSSSYPPGPCSISQDTTYAWTTNGPVLEVFDTRKNERRSVWKFRSDISTLAEFVGPCGRQLIVGLSTTNVLCVFDVQFSKVVKAVKLPYEIISLDVIACKSGTCTGPLSPLLKCMSGLMAVGTAIGYVLLLDLCLDEDLLSDEYLLGEVAFIAKDDQISSKREAAISHGQHLCLALNDNCFLRGHFIHRFGDRNIQVNPGEAAITCVKYIPPLSVLALGFKFGGVQLWNLQKLALQFSWCSDKCFSPVVKFAFQEPENDPRNYCYLWVVSGQHVTHTTSAEIKTVASLYSLACRHKGWIEGFGAIYQDLESCTFRFDYILASDVTDHERTIGSRIITCTCVHPAELMSACRGDELTSDEWLNEDLSLCVLVWESWEENLASTCHLALFDINQWYQAQMPSNIRGEQSSFFGLFSLEEVVAKLQDDDQLMDVCIYPSSLAKFFSHSSSEEFYYPSSLAFRACCLTQKGTIKVSYLGIQRQVLWLMEKNGPHCLLEPGELFGFAVNSGLVEASSSQLRQREELLNLAVENHLLAFLADCILNLHGQDHVSGISLKFLLEWTWKKVSQIKMSVDKLCETLFNCSGQDLDQRSVSLLQSYLLHLKNLAEIFYLLRTNTGPLTEQGEHEIQIRQEVTELFGMYLKAVLWLHQCFLLPEHAEGDAYGENEVSFPTSTLAEAYNHRRHDIQKLHSNVSQTDLLMIDAMVAKMGLANQWEKVAGGGLYPPPSLYAALSSYLLHGIVMEDKHCFLLYLLLDLASFLSDKQSHLEEKLMLFPASFDLCPSRVKLTQGFWMLDHKDFQEALVMFLDPIIKPEDILPWQHMRIMKSYLYQGEHKKALKYAQVRKPPMHTPEQVKLHLTLLLANRLTAEAFLYQRQCREQMSMDDMLNHFFVGCQQTGNMDALLQLPFSPSEEQALVQFLLSSAEPRSQELLIGYFLQRCRPLEAAQLNPKLKPDIMEKPSERDYMAIRSALLSSYLQTLPKAQNKLDAHIRSLRTKSTPQKEEVVQPVPMSSCVKSVSLRHTSLSLFLCHLEDKVRQTCNQSSPSDNDFWTVENAPIVGTPIFRNVAPQRETDVVLATPVVKRPLAHHSEHSWIPNKKSRLLDYNPSKWSSAEKRKSAPFAEALSLLQTPPIKRRSQPIIRERLTEGVSSILKSKTIMRTSPPPFIDPHDGGKALRFSLSPNITLSSRQPLRENLSFDVPSSEVIEDDEITLNYARGLQHAKEGQQKPKTNFREESDTFHANKETYFAVDNDLASHSDNSSLDVIHRENSLPLETEMRNSFSVNPLSERSSPCFPLETEKESSSPGNPTSSNNSSPCSVHEEKSCISSHAVDLPVGDNEGLTAMNSSVSVHTDDSCGSVHSSVKNGLSLSIRDIDKLEHVPINVRSHSSVQTESSSNSSYASQHKHQIHVFSVDEAGYVLIEPLTDINHPTISHESGGIVSSSFASEKCFLIEHASPVQKDLEIISQSEQSSMKSHADADHKDKDLYKLIEKVVDDSASSDVSETDLKIQDHFHSVQKTDVIAKDISRSINPRIPDIENNELEQDLTSVGAGKADTSYLIETNLSLKSTVIGEQAIMEDDTLIVVQKTADDNSLVWFSPPEKAFLSNAESIAPHHKQALKLDSATNSSKEGTSVFKTESTFNTANTTIQIDSAQMDIDVPMTVTSIEEKVGAVKQDETKKVPVCLNYESALVSSLLKTASTLHKDRSSRKVAAAAGSLAPRMMTRRSSSRQSSGSSVKFDVDDSPISGKSADDSFVSATSESLLGTPEQQASLKMAVPQTDSEVVSGTDGTIIEREVKSSSYSMTLRSGSTEAEVPPPVGRKPSLRSRKALNTSASSTESESCESRPRILRTSNKKALHKEIITRTTIPEFSEPNYPKTENIPPPTTPVASVPMFVFSPPLTRSRLRRKKCEERELSPSTSFDPITEEGTPLTRSALKKKTSR